MLRKNEVGFHGVHVSRLIIKAMLENEGLASRVITEMDGIIVHLTNQHRVY